MATITVRGLDDDVVRALKIRAAREGRSMEAEVRSILTDATRTPDSELGIGTLLTQIFGGVEPPEVPPRTDVPEPIDFS